MTSCHFLLFAYVFPEFKDEFPSPRVFLCIYVPGGLAAVASFTPFVMRDITYAAAGVRPVYGKGIILFMVYTIVFMAYGLYLLARKYWGSPGRFA